MSEGFSMTRLTPSSFFGAGCTAGWRRAALAVALCCASANFALAQSALPTEVPKGTALVIADQSERLQTLFRASGEGAKLSSKVTYANFKSGPAILEAFRAGAVDLATVGNAPPIQAHASGEKIPIVAAVRTSEIDYGFVVRPGISVTKLQDLRGKKIAYAEGTGRQPFVLIALKQAGLTNKDVTLVPLRTADFADAVRSGQVDVAPLSEPLLTHYRTDPATKGSSDLEPSEYSRLPRSLGYLYAADKSLRDPAKAAAIREYVIHWIAATKWISAHRDAWVKAYYIGNQGLKEADGRSVAESEGVPSFPSLKSLVPVQQATIDLIHDAGDIPVRLKAEEEFDFRFDAVIAETTQQD
jgi:sulfonate transport system substrate-binding protein